MENKYQKTINSYIEDRDKIVKDLVNNVLNIILFIILYFVITTIWLKNTMLIFSIVKGINILINIYKIYKINSTIRNIQYKKDNDSFNEFVFNYFKEAYKKTYQQNYDSYYSTNNVSSINAELENAMKLFKITNRTSINEIKNIYRQLAIKWHPDKWVNDTKENQEIANRNFKKMQSAYEVIKKYKNIK